MKKFFLAIFTSFLFAHVGFSNTHDWDEKYEEWLLNPEPYGGLEVLQKIKIAKENGDTELNLKYYPIYDLEPIAGLTQIETLDIEESKLTDISPLAGLTALRNLYIGGNQITDISPLSSLIYLVDLDLENNQISDLSPLSNLTTLEQIKLHDNNLSVISPLSSLEKLTELDIGNNGITDFSALTNLSVLSELKLDGNPITASQKAMLEEALPNTYILWPVLIIDDDASNVSTNSDNSQGYAPQSLVGKTIHIPEEGYDSNYYFTEDEAYYMVPLSSGRVDGISYSYVANTSTTATLTIGRESGDIIHQISFSSPTNADSNWSDLASEENGSATLQVHTENYWPSSLAGWTYKGLSMNDTLKFIDDSNAVFYDESDSNFSNRELSNITYTWEQIGPKIGKLTTSLGEETLLFFESNTSGFFDWEETGSDDGNSGQFDLYYYSVGKAFESLVGSSITIGDTTYEFTGLSTATVHSPSGTSSQEYSYLRENEDEALLSVGSTLYKLDFYNHQYGRVERGGSGYFRVLANWATKGWVWQDHYPWAYSNNMQDWYYQVLFINDDNESDMAHYQVWDNQWNIPGELHYSGESNFSSADAYSWEGYDDFNGTELNSSKWDVAWWDGGTAPSIDQLNNRVEFTKGSSYEANLSDLMNAPNPNAEGEYSRGYSSTSGNAPSSLADLVVFVAETAVYSNGSTDYYGEDEIYFSNTHRSRWDWDENRTVTDPYTYAKTGSDTATITINKSGATYTAQLTFTSPTEGIGNWTDYENGQTETGTLTFKIEYSPHSLLELSQSDDIKGIEFELMIPDGAPDQTCIGLFAVDYNAMFNATSDEQEEQAMRFDLDLCYFGGTLTSEFNFKDQTTGQEISEKQSSTLGNFQKFQFYFADGKIYFSLPGQEAKEYNFDRGNETFVIRAQNEQNLDFSVYLRNVRVLRKKSYPQGWMWMDYYPWAYSYESNSWLYFQLAKDTDGQPGMIYWDTATKDWDIYHPSLSPEQVEDQKSATKLLNQE